MNIEVSLLEKLISVVSSALGRASKSYFDKKDVDTDIYKMKKIAKAVHENSLIGANTQYENNGIQISSRNGDKNTEESSLEERTTSRTSFQEEKRQLSLGSVDWIGEKR
ncbi:hypothetical protein [Treponema endosymbiont of Eucomonympha sp.]|uniref:hypothetical protein n=1 Tax=Treponema endosymbiont of Eucomonympha sp. TaxID=1580831 RepID=UPI000750CB48|nr:hypothetical protein [Treponema endosymbiont of Eucomonympha sp.]